MKNCITKPTITAVLPCFNHSSYLLPRIQSVLAQSLTVSEIIFLDDASTDESLALAESILSKCCVDVKIIANRVNSGSPMAQWNKGVRLARGEYIWIAETDDYCDVNLLETLYISLVKCDAVLAFADSNYVDRDGIKSNALTAVYEERFSGSLSHDFCIDGNMFNLRYMMRHNAIPNASAVLFRRDMFVKAGFANASLRFCGDKDMWFRMAGLGNIAFVATKLNSFRFHPFNTSSKRSSPEAQAESLACSLSNIYAVWSKNVDRKSFHPNIGIYAFILLLTSPRRSDLLWALQSFRCKNFYQLLRTYRAFDRVSQPSFGLWLLLFVINYSKYLFRTISFPAFLRGAFV
jgi:glycosyltransferase involved in cell wall biosynthesis